MGSGPGFFPPEGAFFKVNRENVVALGAGSALLLQLAHPLVAAGVAQHSSFLKHPLVRLYRTARPMQQILFGDTRAARAAVGRIQAVHVRVRGAAEDGTPYRASDPRLGLWVHTTLIRSALVAYEELIRPLSNDERASYYDDSKVLARLFGIPDDELPRDYSAFVRYFDEMVEGPVLTVGETGTKLAHAVLHPPIRWIPKAAFRWHRLATAALLPAPLRERYGLSWDETERNAWEVVRRRVRFAWRILPDFLRAAPFALWAERRFRRYRRREPLVTRENLSYREHRP